MIPVRDDVRPARAPVVNHALVGANVAAFVYELSLGPRLDAFLAARGLVPRAFEPWDLATSMFLHAGWLHLAVNMLYLWVFGAAVEGRLGHRRYLLLYLLAGVAAGAGQALTSPGSGVPMVGASGAIAGVLGAYLVFFPRARVTTVLPLFLFFYAVQVPAVLYLGAWFLWQLGAGIGSIGAPAAGGVAVWAHVAGFVAGVVLGPSLRARRAAARVV